MELEGGCGGRQETVGCLGGDAGVYGTDGAAYHFWIRQVRQWNLFNGNAALKDRVPPPADQIETSNCTFTLPLNKPCDANKDTVGLETPVPVVAGQQHTTAWFGDAILIKQYNGAKPNYISWNDADPKAPVWSLRPETPLAGTRSRRCALVRALRGHACAYSRN